MEEFVGVVFAGGRGTRLRPYTDNIPKSLIKIDGKPIIWYALQLFRNADITRIFILGGYKVDDIKLYLKQHNYFDFDITVLTDVSCCPLHALLSLENSISTPFCLLHSDIILSHDTLVKMMRIFRTENPLCVTAVSEDHKISTHPYSTLVKSRISKIELRKPRKGVQNKTSNWYCWCGAYVFDLLIFNYLKSFQSIHGVPEMTLVENISKAKLLAFGYRDEWFHLGYKKDLIEDKKGITLNIINWYRRNGSDY